MSYVIVIILILGGIGWVISKISDFFSDTSGSISDHRAKKQVGAIKRQDLFDKFGERDIELSLVERNRDIIANHLSKIVASPSYREYYYIDNCVRDCINDICAIEGNYNLAPDRLYLSGWSGSANAEYLELSKQLLTLFQNRQNLLKQGLKLESKYLGITKNIHFDALNKINEYVGTFIDAIEGKESAITDAINQITVGEDLLYHTAIVYNEKIYNIADEKIEQVLLRIGGIFTKTGGEAEEQSTHPLIGETVANIIKQSLEGIEISIDSSKSKVDKILESLYFVKIDKFMTLSPLYEEELYSEEEVKILNKLDSKIDTSHREINKKHLQIYKAMQENIDQIVTSRNNKAKELTKAYNEKQAKGIEMRNKKLIFDSKYDDFFEKEFQLEYNKENNTLIIEYIYPDLSSFPNIKEIKKLVNGEIRELKYSDKALSELYDEYLVSVCIRLMYEVFKNDSIGCLDYISFNGRVRTINKASGNEETLCIMSIQTKKSDFKDMKLGNIEPKVCFKSLKGVSASKLSTLTPIRPIQTINRKDKRFVEGYDVIDNVDTSTNLASMDWQDFENLIRELFEKVYSKNGGEVKVTQASRDGGIDAVAFDPDPIKGGKIVIQAKRYTNVVGVSAVRDLYGSVHNEGAMKGILVTTSNYGSDAYQFAKDKPLTLINGNELLYLLEEHGYHANINIKEARKEFKDTQKK